MDRLTAPPANQAGASGAAIAPQSPARTVGNPAPFRDRVRYSIDARRLERTRLLQGLTREAVAKRARISIRTTHDLFTGRRRPQLATLFRVLKVLEITEPDTVISFVDD